MGISRGERMDFSIQKAVELGVSHFQPLFTERCMVQLKGDRQQSRLDHWRGVIRHVCE
jgi:16S rRNA (uracil1498-N3)-methyltransferase